jgi:hypothetical protein
VEKRQKKSIEILKETEIKNYFEKEGQYEHGEAPPTNIQI